jgi:hypothetical protein
MAPSNSLVLYKSSSSALTTQSSSSRSLAPARLFTATTGTAIATELLYRLLWDIINRLLHSFQRLASDGMDQLSEFWERKMAERKERQLEAAKAKAEANRNGKGLGILEEVERLNEERNMGFQCPMGGEMENMKGPMGPPQPPRWVMGVLEGVKEGRMEEKDFWIHTHTG